MIDERSLLNWLRNYQFENYAEVGHEKEYNFIENLIKRIENEPKVGEWIPCSERLPNKYDNLLICQSDGYVNVGYYSLNDFKDINSYPYKDVIAWQPLPEPYKGE